MPGCVTFAYEWLSWLFHFGIAADIILNSRAFMDRQRMELLD